MAATRTQMDRGSTGQGHGGRDIQVRSVNGLAGQDGSPESGTRVVREVGWVIRAVFVVSLLVASHGLLCFTPHKTICVFRLDCTKCTE